jgi:hypothetical protein
LSIDSLKTGARQFTVKPSALPIFVSQKDSSVLEIWFRPDSVRVFIDTLRIYSNQLQSLVRIPLTGTRLTSVVLTGNIVPARFELNQNYPNPFNPSTTLKYGLPMDSRVRLNVYNVLGQRVSELVNREQSAGWYSVSWNADAASGIYFYRIEAASRQNPDQQFVDVKKMILSR